jgi:putative glycoprotease GCP
MLVLGIESSCDECAAAVVEDGSRILSDVVATQIPFHEKYQGVVPEIASRMHSEWVYGVVEKALAEAGVKPADLGGVAATARPGLIGSLLVGFCFAKGLAWSIDKPFVGVNHILGHLYASRLDPGTAYGATLAGPEAGPIDYPFIGLLVSGGHSIICKVSDFDQIEVLGTTIDDAVGEAFDKVAKHYGFGYPGGVAIDRLSQKGDERAFSFPMPNLHKGEHRYDVSYSGLKTACVRQLDLFKRPGAEATPENIAASFQKAAVDMLLSRLFRVVEDTGIRKIVAGGGVAANSYLRRTLAARADLELRFPPLKLCGDNGAMIAGVGYQYLKRGEASGFDSGVSARVPLFRRLQN